MKWSAHEHESLRKLVELLKDAVGTKNRCEIAHAAERLFIAVMDHVKDEESPRGFFSEVEHTDPRMIPAVVQMRAQHQDIRKLLEQIVNEALENTDQLSATVEHFFQMFVRHEANEEKLVREVFYQDQTTGGD